MKTTKYRGIDLAGIDLEIDTDAAKSFIDFRREAKKPLTQRAFDQAMKKALQAHQLGMTPTELIDFTVDKGWSGININYTMAALQNEQNALLESCAPKSTTRNITLQQELTDKGWAH